MTIDKANFCMAPFREVVIETNGTLIPCCEYKYPAPKYQSQETFGEFDQWWSEDMGHLREQMLTNQTNAGCGYCKSKEQIPGQNHLRHYINNKYRQETPWIKPVEPRIEFMEVRFGNYCNLSCIMCGAYASSSIAAEYVKHKDKFIQRGFRLHNEASLKTQRWWEEPGALDRLYTMARDVKYIHFTGGEPMMIPEVVDILNTMDPARVIKVSMNTNLTKFNERIYTALSRFQSVQINASMEGVAEHNDYVRYGSQWHQLEEAIVRLRTMPNVDLLPVHVLQHTSIFTLPRLKAYCQSNNLPLKCSEVYPNSGHGVLTIDSVSPADVAGFQQYLAQNPDPTFQAWVNKYNFDPERHARYREYVALLDSIRNTDFDAVFHPNWVL
jgi:radical SAM protein with 4Fe4S-binding SPASM domain